MNKSISNEIIILLTGTIASNAIHTKHNCINTRRNEYLNALKYYSKFGKVYFLENSDYKIMEDSDFLSMNNVSIVKFPSSNNYKRGKGYQEFEMIDQWVRLYANQIDAFLKITGRYIIHNIKDVVNDCNLIGDQDIIIERKMTEKDSALTDIFFIKVECYQKKLIDAYKSCDDEAGIYVEHIVGKILSKYDKARVFKDVPIKVGINGSEGKPLDSGFIFNLKVKARNILYLIHKERRIF